ncbi:MAG TPA: PAS domain-containing protein [Draconibacterium sp.]|nr:PAS domain-containing protein [Draconibacterium sp.]
MSEFTNHKDSRVNKLVKLFQGILSGENPGQLVAENQKLIESVIPSDVILMVDRLMMMKIPMDDLKRGINKILNVLRKTVSEYEYNPPAPESYLGVLVENNRILDDRLKEIRPLLREINRKPENTEVKSKLHANFKEVEKFNKYYLIKENVLFPIIEKHFPEHRCLSVMWSFHDDIKTNLKLIIKQLADKDFNLKAVNKLAGDLFFSIYAIKFREERILFPLVQEIVSEDVLNNLYRESLEIGFPYYQPEFEYDKEVRKIVPKNKIDLETGNLNAEQIKLLFNHLPVDITFVDENDKVVYFSSPKKRIFPRTKSIIGRDVHNCHPPESVHVVEEIVESFRNGKKDVASFWINMKGEKLLIQYFAIRNENGEYKGVVEVSQEISEIQNLQGEKRLLDWGN